MQVRDDINAIIKQMHQKGKPIGALCISPVLLAKVLQDIVITVGTDPATAADVQKLGARHINTQQTEVIADKQNMVFSTPCHVTFDCPILKKVHNLIGTILENL